MNKTVENNASEFQELLIRLERNNRLVQRLSRKLNSYTCEPTDRSCFERFDNLKRAFRSFKDQHGNLSKLLSERNEPSVSLKTQIQSHLERFRELEKEIAQYILSTNKYY